MHEAPSTHAPSDDSSYDFPGDVNFTLNVVEGILNRVFPAIDHVKNGSHHPENMVDKKNDASIYGEIDKELIAVMQQVSTELWYKNSMENVENKRLAIFNKLSSYQWYAKAAISIASFAINLGEIWLVTLLSKTNPLAKSVANLKQVSNINDQSSSLKSQIDQSSLLKSRLDEVNNLVRTAFDLTKCLCEFKGLPLEYILDSEPSKKTAEANFPNAVQWIIKALITSESHIKRLLRDPRSEIIQFTGSPREISHVLNHLKKRHNELKEELDHCNQLIDGKKSEEYFHRLVSLFKTPQEDNQEILPLLIYSKDGLLQLEIGTTKEKVGSVEKLRWKTILLLISDLNISFDEVLGQLVRVYQKSRKLQLTYEIVWLPIVHRSISFSKENDRKFRRLKSNMPWYTLNHPSLLHPAVTRYIKEVWHYAKKPILVALDTQGNVVSQNAFHQVWIWGNKAYPFADSKEDDLWRNETWTLPFLVHDVDQVISDWIKDDKYVCLYGGYDIKWIDKFTTKAKEVANHADIRLEMVYVGGNNIGNSAKVHKMNEIISEKHYSRCWEDNLTSVWYFWTRLESMMHSKFHQGRTVKGDQILREVLSLLTYGSSDNWALIGRGSSTALARAKGDRFLAALEEFKSWEGEAKQKGFVPALIDYFARSHTTEHCDRLYFPGVDGDIPETLICTECHRTMEKYTMFRCCSE